MNFYDRVKQLVAERKTTIEYVISKAGLTRSMYNSKKSAGNLPRANEAVDIAKELRTTVEFLVTGELPDKKCDLYAKYADVIQIFEELSLEELESIITVIHTMKNKRK